MPDSIDKHFGGIKRSETSLDYLIKVIREDSQLKGAFCFNMFTQDVEHSQDNILLAPTAREGTTITDNDMHCLRAYISTKFSVLPSMANLENALVAVALENRYHPIKEYLEGLKWDGLSRLDRWLVEICGAEDTSYTHAVGRKMLVAAVKRVYEPGCYYAQLVILEGRQRMYKSRLVKEIGKDWYASIHLKTQDTKTIVEEMKGKWILEIEELAGFGKQETEYMKAFVSRQSDRVRLSYGRRAQDYPRQSILIATMNPDFGENKYLIDQTGNVRYWPVKCSDSNKIKTDMFKELRDQLFAEAMVLYGRGETLWLDNDVDEKLADMEQEKRLSTDPWGPIIIGWLEEQHGINYLSRVTANDIAQQCLKIPLDRINTGICRRICRAIAVAGWVRHRETSGKTRGWYYVPPKTDVKEVAWDDEQSDAVPGSDTKGLDKAEGQVTSTPDTMAPGQE